MEKQIINKSKVIVGGWGTINCEYCNKENVAGIITMWINDTPAQMEICNSCLVKYFEEVKELEIK